MDSDVVGVVRNTTNYDILLEHENHCDLNTVISNH